ncbi:S28 family serine protease [Pyxidicoccus caerfyrddinensis]|uniref:S28 family serine protease n=1 Tax=Pyxidicoccus caerfyrddinensis TaxID=2709663 RepID=UPI0013DB1A88|nr:S28 family serine protease [Pyxidicoccus caerfyrddinensis]
MKRSEAVGVFKGAGWLVVAVLLQSCGDTALAESSGAEPPARAVGALEAVADSEDILTRLQSIPGLTVLDERPSPYAGTRFFRMVFEQPADHRRPLGERFQLRVNLLHRSVDAPMVLYGGGYGLGDNPSRAEPTALLGANQLSLEHRFFGTSRPASNDWKLLDIRQAAGDYHRIVEAFKPLYSGRWLNTGGSKGGMAAVYHRYFYPDDVDVTVPYVAPNSHGLDDGRYARFVEQVGDADCRAKLQAFQQAVLLHRAEMMPFMEELVVLGGTDFHVIGGRDRALEFAVVEASFYFWQYWGTPYCEDVPAPDAPAAELFGFLDGIVAIAFTYGDVWLDYYAAYYYQAATELGFTRFSTRHLHGLLRYPGEDEPRAYLSFPVRERFDHDLMHRVEHWVRSQGERMLFIYGENDPWSSGAFSVRERNDSFRFIVPGGEHGSRISRLPEPERTQAVEHLYRWMGLDVSAAGARALTLEAELDAERSMEPRFRL